MADRRTLEDVLRAAPGSRAGKAAAVASAHECPNCGRSCRAFEIVDVTDIPGIPTDMACTGCFIDAKRESDQVAERRARKTLPAWETPEAIELKAYRGRMLDLWRWTVLPDSPLSTANQRLWMDYLQAWHRMTVDAAGPAEFKEPDRPVMEYAPAPTRKGS